MSARSGIDHLPRVTLALFQQKLAVEQTVGTSQKVVPAAAHYSARAHQKMIEAQRPAGTVSGPDFETEAGPATGTDVAKPLHRCPDPARPATVNSDPACQWHLPETPGTEVSARLPVHQMVSTAEHRTASLQTGALSPDLLPGLLLGQMIGWKAGHLSDLVPAKNFGARSETKVAPEPARRSGLKSACLASPTGSWVPHSSPRP